MKQAEMINWAQGVLGGKVDVQPVVETFYSNVKKLEIGGEVFYLKQTPPALFIETDIINFLRNTCDVTAIPEIIAQDKTLGCFIMKSCGEESLRTMFARTFDMNLFLQGIQTYKSIQKSTEKHTARLLEMGAADWRLTRLPDMYNDMVHDQNFMTRCEMTQDQAGRLRGLKGSFAKLCEDLASFNIPDCLNHSDFHANNILVDKVGKNVTVIDWGEVTIGNPLLPLTKPLKTVSARHNFNAETYKMAEEKFYGDFFASPTDMARAGAITEKISQIYYIFTLRKLEELSGQALPQSDNRMGAALVAFLEG